MRVTAPPNFNNPNIKFSPGEPHFCFSKLFIFLFTGDELHPDGMPSLYHLSDVHLPPCPNMFILLQWIDNESGR